MCAAAFQHNTNIVVFFPLAYAPQAWYRVEEGNRPKVFDHSILNMSPLGPKATATRVFFSRCVKQGEVKRENSSGEETMCTPGSCGVSHPG